MNCCLIGFSVITEFKNEEKVFKYFERLIKRNNITKFLFLNEEEFNSCVFGVFRKIQEKYTDIEFLKLNISNLRTSFDSSYEIDYKFLISISDLCLIYIDNDYIKLPFSASYFIRFTRRALKYLKKRDIKKFYLPKYKE